MSFLNWQIRKKLSIFLIVFLTIAVLVSVVVYLNWPESSCFDGRQNQEEQGVDCGGPCIPCVINPKEVVSLWTRIFPTGDNTYEAAALVENPNISYGLSLLKYTFKLYDVNNILIGVKEGQTFLNPADKFVVFVSNIETGERKAVRGFVELEKLSPWKYIEEKKSSLVVSGKSFSRSPFPSLTAKIFNQSIFPLEEIQAAAVLYDKDKNAIAVSSTRIDFVPAEGGRDIIFTWPESFDLIPDSSAIYTRIDQTK